MNEASEQAVQVGTNVTIFVIALTISMTLLLGVKDVAEKAFSYNASLPTGSRTVTAETQTKRIIKGYELLSYYANYMTDVNHGLSGKYLIAIEDSLGNKKIISNKDEGEIKITAYSSMNQDIKKFFKDNGVNLSKDYEIIINEYNKSDEILYITLKEI